MQDLGVNCAPTSCIDCTPSLVDLGVNCAVNPDTTLRPTPAPIEETTEPEPLLGVFDILLEQGYTVFAEALLAAGLAYHPFRSRSRSWHQRTMRSISCLRICAGVCLHHNTSKLCEMF